MTEMEPQETLTEFWAQKPELIRRFLSERRHFRRLGAEVSYALERELANTSVEVSEVRHRTKSLESFVEKVHRKGYEKPFEQMTDIAATRIVYLYRGDLEAIERIVRSVFEVHERVDKLAELGLDHFGYGALHFIVSLGEGYSGPRYDDLKGRLAELQVGTVLQDAWAIIDHHLKYKNAAATPSIIRRGLASLAGLFEGADHQFDSLRADQVHYETEVRASAENDREFLDKEIDLETLREYLSRAAKEKPVAEDESHLARVIRRMKRLGYTHLRDVQNLLESTRFIREQFSERFPSPFSLGEVVVAMALEHSEYRKIGLLPAKQDLLEKLARAGNRSREEPVKMGNEPDQRQSFGTASKQARKDDHHNHR